MEESRQNPACSYNAITLPTTVDIMEQQKPSHRIGYLYMLFASFNYVFTTMAERFAIHVYHIPISVTIFAQGVIPMLLAPLYMYLFDDARIICKVPSHLVPCFFMRVLFGSLGFAWSTAIVAFIPAGDASGLYLAAPVITMLLSACLLNERMSRANWFSTMLSAAGVVMLSVPGGSGSSVSAINRITGVGVGLLSAIANALAFILSGYMGEQVHSMAIVTALGVGMVIYGVGTGAVTGIAWCLSMGNALAVGMGYVMVSGISSFLAAVSFNRGLQLCRAGPGAMISHSSLPLVYVFSYFTLKETPTILRIAGSSLLLVASVIEGVVTP